MFPATSLPHKRMNSGRTELNCLHEFPGLGCSHYTTPRNLVRQVRLELTIPCLRGRCLDPVWLLTHGGTERTRTVIGLVDNQVPHLSATVPCEKILASRATEKYLGGSKGLEPSTAAVTVRGSAN